MTPKQKPSLQNFLSKGLFPSDLPPLFSSKSFGVNSEKLPSKDIVQSNIWTQYESFSLPKPRHGRRTAGIVNPIPFYGLAKLITDHWNEIQEIYERSPFSFSRPEGSQDLRAITQNDYFGFRNSAVTRASGYGFVLRSDFATFFPTLYTHAIEWAVDGKVASKKKLTNKGRKSALTWGGELDRLVRNMQDGQTHGLPIGPDTSYIVCELVASAIDHEFLSQIKTSVPGVRLVDDYLLFFDTRAAAEQALTTLESVASDFRIALNSEKTVIEAIHTPSRETWTYTLSDFRFAAGIERQRKALLRFTDTALVLFEANANASIGRFSIKILSKIIIHQKNLDIAIACVLRLAFTSPTSFSDFAGFIIGYRNAGFYFDIEPVKRFLNSQLLRTLDLKLDKEASWCLWLAIELGINFSKIYAQKISRSQSSVVLLLAKFAEEKGLLTDISQSIFSQKLSEDDFKSQHWLLAYEGAMQGWFGWKRQDICGILKPLADAEIRFIDRSARTKSAVKAKKALAERNLFEMEFDELDDFFETEVDLDGYDSVDEDVEENESSESDDDVDDAHDFGDY